MGDLILITGSRLTTPAMITKAKAMVSWIDREGHCLLVGDARGIDAVVREHAYRLSLLTFVYGAFGKIRGPYYEGEQHSTVEGDYPERDRAMAERCDRCIVIEHMGSRTKTAHFIGLQVEELGKPVTWYRYEDTGRWQP